MTEFSRTTKFGASGLRCVAAALLCLLFGGCSVTAFGKSAPATAWDAAGPATESAPAAGERPAAGRRNAQGGLAALGDLPGLGFLFNPETDEDGEMPARLQIYTAQIELEVPRVDAAIATCRAVTEEFGGFLAARVSNSLTCRVPAARFEEFLDRMRALGRVLGESMQAADVTDQHRDLGIRLENARNARTRLLALLEKAEKVEDVLAIERELQRLTEEIERGEAQLAALDDQIALSTITVQLQAPRDKVPGDPRRREPSPFAWINEIGIEEVLRWD